MTQAILPLFTKDMTILNQHQEEDRESFKLSFCCFAYSIPIAAKVEVSTHVIFSKIFSITDKSFPIMKIRQ
jgi:hypothetical protein